MTIIDEITERQLLAGMLCEAHVLAVCDDVETDDFTDYRHWVVLAAIRQLQGESADVDPFEVDEVITQRDRTADKHIAQQAGAQFLSRLIAVTFTYGNAMTIVENDIRWLRVLAGRRRILVEAA